MSVTATIAPSDRRQLEGLLGALRLRLGAEQALRLALRTFSAALAIVIVLYLMSWASGWEAPHALAVTLVGGALMVAIGLAAGRWPSTSFAAHEADRRLLLGERLTTALDSVSRSRRGSLASLQVAEAIQTTRAQLRSWPFATRELRRDGLTTLGLACAAATVIFLTGLGERSLLPRPSLDALLEPLTQPRSEPEAAESDPQVAARQESPPGSTSAVAPLLRTLDDVRRARDGNTLSQDEAGRRVDQAEAELRRQSQESQAQRQDLNRLAQALSQVSASRPAAESIERGDYQRAGAQLTELGTEADQLSQTAKEELARELRNASADTGRNRLLADRERRAAEALTGRDYTQQRRSLRELGEEVTRAGSSIVPQQDLAEGMSRVQDLQRELDRPSRSDRAAEGDRQTLATAPESSATAPNQSRGASSTQGAENQAASQQGAASNAAGTGDNPLDEGQGSSAGGSAPGQSRFESAAPRLDVAGRRVEVPVKVGRGPTSQRAAGQEEPMASEDLAAQAVTGGLNQSAESSLVAPERNTVPAERRRTVRDYFQGEGPR